MTTFCFGHNIHALESMFYLWSGHSYFMLLFPLQSLIPLVMSVSQTGRGFTMISFMYTFYFEEKAAPIGPWCFTFALGQTVNHSFFQTNPTLNMWISQVQSTFIQFFLERSLIGWWKMKHFAAMALLMRNRQYSDTFVAVAYICSSCRRFKVHKPDSTAECDPWGFFFCSFSHPMLHLPMKQNSAKDSANCPHTPPL